MNKNLLVAPVIMVLALLLGGVAPVLADAPGAGQKNEIEAGLAALEKQDFAAARTAFAAAAAHGDALGDYHLGAMLQRGLGGERSETKALEHYRVAAEKNIPEAEFALGLFHQHGRAFLPKNPDVAVSWYGKAAAQGSVAAMYNLGMMFATGEAVPVAYGSNPDYIKARGWFLIVLDHIEDGGDKAKIETILSELEGHMTAGQKERADRFHQQWTSAHP